jgi:hypothetical protein
MSNTPDRKMQRNAAKIAKNDAKRLFREALREGARVEREIKAAVCGMKLHHRISVACQILRGRWV